MIQQWVKARYGVRVLIIVVQHTFGGRLNFHPHLHLLISNGGLQESEGRWISPLRFNGAAVMRMWRYAVITYLREAVRAGLLKSAMGTGELRQILTRQYERWWNTYIGRHFRSKAQFLRYAGRYIRRPPIAQHRFVDISASEVHYSGKDSRGKRRVRIRFSTQHFITILAEHVPDRYHHAVRYFGLLAPRSAASFSAIFMLLEQQQRSRPRRLSWAASLRKTFGVDPLIDSRGQPMRWVHRLSPIVPQRHPA